MQQIINPIVRNIGFYFDALIGDRLKLFKLAFDLQLRSLEGRISEESRHTYPRFDPLRNQKAR